MTGITHVVLVEWQQGTDPSAEADVIVREHLPGIEGVVSVTSGTSVSPEEAEGGFDWMLVVRFTDRDALERYLPHPEHQPVGAYIGASSSRVVVFDVAG